MDTAAAYLALILADDLEGARMLGPVDPVAVAQAARRVIGDLGLDHDFSLADAVDAARWEIQV